VDEGGVWRWMRGAKGLTSLVAMIEDMDRKDGKEKDPKADAKGQVWLKVEEIWCFWREKIEKETVYC
jgi:hypothetical protein